MNCKNCQTLLTVDSDYCYSCGGKVIRNRLTIRNLFSHFTETFFNFDNKFFQTFFGLFRKPEDVIGCYIEGTRKKYVDVVSYFALAITISGLQVFILNKFFPEAMDMSKYPTQAGSATQNNDVMEFVQEYQAIIMMLYVPIYAIISRIVFLNKKTYNYTEQLVIYMYIQAQVSIAGAFIMTSLVILGFNYFSITFPFIAAMIAYAAYCLKKLYTLNISEIILKTLIFLLILGFLFVIMSIIVGAFMVINAGGFQEFIEARKGVS